MPHRAPGFITLTPIALDDLPGDPQDVIGLEPAGFTPGVASALLLACVTAVVAGLAGFFAAETLAGGLALGLAAYCVGICSFIPYAELMKGLAARGR